ncbi:MAG: periplasmic heavy metal sensor [Hyphomonadaceae bacterium]
MSNGEEKRGTAVWLIGSFILNALLIGLMIGMFLASPKGRGGQPPPQGGLQVSEEQLARSVVQAAPPAERRAVRQRMVQAWRGAEAERETLATTGRAVVQAMQAEPYHVAVMQAALTDWREADAALKATIQDAIADVLARLPAEQRKALAEDMVHRAEQRVRRGQRQRREGREERQRPPREREGE